MELGALMRTPVNYAERAEECRRLAKLYTRPEDWAHFLEMAETWDMLLKHEQDTSRSQTVALADRIRNVLFFSEDRSEETMRPL
jgi:hypothetical protein